MRLKKLVSAIIISSLLALSINASPGLSAQTGIDAFWAKLKAAVARKDKGATYRLVKLPFTMPYGQKTIRTKAQFVQRYNQIFNGEADAAKCFAKTQPQKVSAKRYEVACGFKNDPDGSAGTPITYSIELTDLGWKLTGLDNINE